MINFWFVKLQFKTGSDINDIFINIKKGNVATTLVFLKTGGHKESMLILKDAGVDFTQTISL